jgi:hypothetical protein
MEGVNHSAAIIVAFAACLCCPAMAAYQSAEFRSLAATVSRSAEPALRSWLASIDRSAISNYGFRSPDEMQRAALLPPIPYFTPERKRATPPSKPSIEANLDELPTSWLVPVRIDDRIACVIVVDTIPGRPPEATEYGKTYTANRLTAGLRRLGWPNHIDWRNLRFLSFVDPNTDLLLHRTSARGWTWVNLAGTTAAEAVILTPEQLSSLLQLLRRPAADLQ